jgi:transcriptional regulator with XRE-family HTH domain
MSKNKLIAARKEKHKTQHDMATSLFMSQSQYSRREHEEIHISDKEWMGIATILEKEFDDIKEEDSATTIYNYDNYSTNKNIIKNLQDYIEMLKRENEDLKSALDKK